MSSTRLKHAVEEQVLEQWQLEHRSEQELDGLGFTDDDEVCVLGLDEMEDELTMEQAERLHRMAPFVNYERHAYRAIPLSSATPEEARSAREHDVDDVAHREWDTES